MSARPKIARGDLVEITGEHPWQGRRGIVLSTSPVHGLLLNLYATRRSGPRRTYAAPSEVELVTTDPGRNECPDDTLRDRGLHTR